MFFVAKMDEKIVPFSMLYPVLILIILNIINIEFKKLITATLIDTALDVK